MKVPLLDESSINGPIKDLVPYCFLAGEMSNKVDNYKKGPD